MGLEDLRAGAQTIRNEKGWRDNEKQIDYVWMIAVAHSFREPAMLFAIQYEAWQFRDRLNPPELVTGIFTFNKAGIQTFYSEVATEPADPILPHFHLDLFNANRGITIDGVGYQIRIRAHNTETYIEIGNPKEAGWGKWEEAVWQLGRHLAKKSAYQAMQNIFS